MAPKFRGIPKGAPFPTTPLNILIEQAKEARKVRLEKLREMTGNSSEVDATPLPQTIVTSKVNLMMMKPKVTSAAHARPGFSAASSSSSSFASGSPSASAGILMKASPKAITKSTSAVSTRRDKPVVKDTKRGDKKRALEIAADPELLQDAIAVYEKEIRSSGDTSEFNVKTWFDIHEAVNWKGIGMDFELPALPLTPRIITVIGAVMKAAGYRSTKNYMSAVKAVHIQRGHRWNEQLDLAAHNFNLSTTRGVGPVRQSEPLPFDRVAKKNLDEDKTVSDARYPRNPAAMFVIVVFFMLRELEVATARLCDLSFSDEDKEVRLHLSVSKNDPQARGTWRPWRCICSGDEGDSAHRRCPYHAAKHHHDYLVKNFKDCEHDADFPLFPTWAGLEV